MDADNRRLNEISRKVIGAAMRVSNNLGSGFLEKVYENALVHELRKADVKVAQQHVMSVSYDGVVVGEYAADLLVDDGVLVELKAVRALDEVHMAQCMNYLKATGLRVCLLLNFGQPRLQVKRIVRDF
ncbi:MAG: GxxExxY protein [candidate division NC10 bacterium]